MKLELLLCKVFIVPQLELWLICAEDQQDALGVALSKCFINKEGKYTVAVSEVDDQNRKVKMVFLDENRNETEDSFWTKHADPPGVKEFAYFLNIPLDYANDVEENLVLQQTQSE